MRIRSHSLKQPVSHVAVFGAGLTARGLLAGGFAEDSVFSESLAGFGVAGLSRLTAKFEMALDAFHTRC